MRTLQVYIAIGALSWASCKPSRDCDFGSEMFDCVKKIRFDVSGSLDHFMDEKELNNSCRKFMTAAECMVQLAQWCTRNRKAIMEIILEQYKYTIELCDEDSDFRREYLKHSQCLNENKSGFTFDCNEAVQAPQHPNPDYDECLNFKNVSETCGYDIEMTCGEDATKMVMRLMEPIETYYKKTCPTL